MKIRTLDKEFIKRGIRYTEVLKNEKYVIYSCHDDDINDTYYEVFKYRLAKPHPLDTGGWDKVELYPSDNAFGVWAWCCSNDKSVNKILSKHFNVKEPKIRHDNVN